MTSPVFTVISSTTPWANGYRPIPAKTHGQLTPMTDFITVITASSPANKRNIGRPDGVLEKVAAAMVTSGVGQSVYVLTKTR